MQHLIAFLLEYVLIPRRPPILLIGHSIGCLMLLRALPRVLPCAAGCPPILKLIFMFPFVEADADLLSVRLLGHACNMNHVVSLATHALRNMLPDRFLDFLITRYIATAEDRHSRSTMCLTKTIKKHLAAPTLRQYLFLASCYVLKVVSTASAWRRMLGHLCVTLSSA